jgi:hypothetical protein
MHDHEPVVEVCLNNYGFCLARARACVRACACARVCVCVHKYVCIQILKHNKLDYGTVFIAELWKCVHSLATSQLMETACV